MADPTLLAGYLDFSVFGLAPPSFGMPRGHSVESPLGVGQGVLRIPHTPDHPLWDKTGQRPPIQAQKMAVRWCLSSDAYFPSDFIRLLLLEVIQDL